MPEWPESSDGPKTLPDHLSIWAVVLPTQASTAVQQSLLFQAALRYCDMHHGCSVSSLLDGKGKSVYSPFSERGEPLTKPVELPQGTLEMLILKAVSLGSLHGYGILLRIQQISGERLEILQGSFYTAIYRLERRGWIKGEWGESENNRRARFYSLTAAGTRQLKAETAKWIDMASVVAGILDKKVDEI
jgi:transcriptional regulator